MNIGQLIGGRKFATLRALISQFNRLYPKWAKAKKMGGAKNLEVALKSLLDKNSTAGTRVATLAADKIPGLGGMLQGGQALAMAPSLCANAICGGAKGDYDEKRNLDDLMARIEGEVQRIPEWGDESIEDLKQDSALLADLEQFSEYQEELLRGGPESKVGPVLSMIS